MKVAVIKLIKNKQSKHYLFLKPLSLLVHLYSGRAFIYLI
jgi:hypothetical protein